MIATTVTFPLWLWVVTASLLLRCCGAAETQCLRFRCPDSGNVLRGLFPSHRTAGDKCERSRFSTAEIYALDKQPRLSRARNIQFPRPKSAHSDEFPRALSADPPEQYESALPR